MNTSKCIGCNLCTDCFLLITDIQLELIPATYEINKEWENIKNARVKMVNRGKKLK